MEIIIAAAGIDEVPELLALYKKVAQVKDGIIRKEHEVDIRYVSDFLSKARDNGIILVAQKGNKIIGEIHAYVPPLFAFQHTLTDLTIVVDPDYHGQGIGRKLFDTFLTIVKERYRHILRVELFVREHNTRNVAFYESLGFKNEGRQEFKIFKGNNEFETPLHMAWINPVYNQQS